MPWKEGFDEGVLWSQDGIPVLFAGIRETNKHPVKFRICRSFRVFFPELGYKE